jgi:hypothetical protein
MTGLGVDTMMTHATYSATAAKNTEASAPVNRIPPAPFHRPPCLAQRTRHDKL